MSTKAFILLFLSFFATCLNAQQYSFRNITTDEGLPTSECYQILQDSMGYIWVSTNAGIGKYNGKTFKTFTTENGLTDNIVFKTFEDEQGRLFYITGNTRLGYLKNDSAYALPITDSFSKIMSTGSFFIYNMCNYDKERFLIATQMGFYLLDKKSLSKLSKVPGKPNANFWLRVIDKKAIGAYYSLSPAKKSCYNLCVENNGRSIFIPLELTSSAGPSIYKTCYLSDGTILAGFGDRIITISPDGTYKIKKLPAMLIEMTKDKNDGIWICMLNNGLYYYSKKSRLSSQNENIDLDNGYEHLFKGESPSSVLMDKEGGIWVSTLHNGIYYCPNFGVVNYANIKQLSSRLYGLNHIGAYMITNGLDKTIFIFKNKKEFRSVDLPDGKNIQGAYSYYKQGAKVYAAGYSSSYILDTNFRFLKALTDKENKQMLIYNLAESENKKLLGVRFCELLYLNNDTIVHDINLTSRGRDIAVDGSGKIYVAMNTGLYLRSENDLIKLKAPAARINKLKKDPDGHVWACTDGKGVVEIDGMNVLKKYTTDDGLASDICYDIAFDKNKNYWVATNKGLCFIDHVYPQKIYTLKKQNGLLSNEIFKIEIKEDELYIVTQKGLCIANVADLYPTNFAPQVYISGIICNNKELIGSNSFSFDQNSFKFKTEGLSFQNSTDITYQYRLMGYDSLWNINNTGEMTFNDLKDGSYVFEVKAINVNGIKSNVAATYSFLIKKPFWKEVWFVLLSIILFAWLVYLIFRWRVRKVRYKELKKTYINKVMAEYQMSALRSQMNPHFIFNAINSIQHYILSNEKQYAYDYLTKFSKLIRLVLANSQEKITTLKKEIELLELYIEIEKLRFKDRFQHVIIYEDSLPVEEMEIPIMLLQPFVENAIWHGIMNMDETRTGMLTIRFEFEDKVLHITIEDNGVGREKAAQFKNNNGYESIGMRLSQERLAVLEVLGGEDAKIEITDLYNEAGACGTRVELFITITI